MNSTTARKESAKPTAQQKEIGYAYPSSIWAKDCGFYKTGCYVVRLVTWMDTHVSMVGGFATFTDAAIAADKLPQEFSRWTMKELSAEVSP